MRKLKIIILVFICVGIGFSIGISFKQAKDPIYSEEAILLPEHPFYLLEEVNEEVLYNTLKHYDFPNPAIITAQAVLESGNFKSRLCINHNNLFGLYNSRRMEYFTFDSWISCVFAYKTYILSKYKEGEDYYLFLERINYAEDPSYISKLKTLENKILHRYETKKESKSK